jgi:hypothetical protein
MKPKINVYPDWVDFNQTGPEEREKEEDRGRG